MHAMLISAACREGEGIPAKLEVNHRCTVQASTWSQERLFLEMKLRRLMT
jgi:hypothetical protein